MSFERAHAFTSKWEGGLVDHPADPGGITNYGISFRFLVDYAKNNVEFLHFIKVLNEDQQLPTADTIRKLTKEQATLIYKKAFWFGARCDRMPELVAITHYDFAVNAGVAQAARTLQRVVGAKVDGVVGSQTLGILDNACDEIGAYQVASDLCDARKKFYEDLVEKKPSSKVFLSGWMNRIKALRKYLA